MLACECGVCIVIRGMEDNFTRRSGAPGELEADLLCPTEVAGIVNVLAKNAFRKKKRKDFCEITRSSKKSLEHMHKAEWAVDHHGAKAKMLSGALGVNSGEVPPGSLGRRDVVGGSWAVRENEESKEPMMEKWRRKAEESRVSDVAGIRNPKLWKCSQVPEELGVGVYWKSSLGQRTYLKKRKAVAQKESADPQEYEWCQQNEMDVDTTKSLEELGFIASAVSDSAGWREPFKVK